MMDFPEVIRQVNDLFCDVLDDDSIKLTSETTAKDVDDWDSLTHIQLIVAVEKHFKIKFKLAEVQGLKNVGDMCYLIIEKVKGNADQ
jgi:acyl carrier protein